jgi:tRNA threonylcarbamoyladenosine biosynthesis protein TsaE
MVQKTLSKTLNAPEETSHFAQCFAQFLQQGDVVLLEGQIGAGKTHFARELISVLLIEPEDIPSPTYTIVQTYESCKGEIWHADLYRLTDPNEVFELGLLDAFSNAICLVEWPDRLHDIVPRAALKLTLETGSHVEQRRLKVSWHDERWNHKLQDFRCD